MEQNHGCICMWEEGFCIWCNAAQEASEDCEEQGLCGHKILLMQQVEPLSFEFAGVLKFDV